ncbi:hypothetical protein GGI04_001583 [Coemansia thaxteri]|uniref:Methyltransferase type 11 domain-containing protein n=1 Tax=Coemansia thaxteri TaxID=2663907 RepID=A0A9W8BGG8_9FUNG|nr:hypothetical protein GGI04_001583 [Coemansia thaxteri]KAJ2007740.1 hypothetical protein H4R26_000621 [Coemansia thaxteri]KAJ2472845.1 hypothetical protein GGI02_001297 [Coemansia sp. RSA 2322]KAJ2487502.1 hypothetical protein EV174_000480 [Coemansia sp. RSA 2320]
MAVYDWMFSTMWIIESTRNDNKVDVYRKTIWHEISGNVLELGPGFAGSLKFLAHATTSDGSFYVDPDVIQSYTALEPNPFMYPRLQNNAEVNGFAVDYDRLSCVGCNVQDTDLPKAGLVPFKIVRGTLDDPENIPKAILEQAPFDSILTSFSLCTVRHPETALKNIQQLLKPGGSFYFIEHVRQPARDDPTVVEDNGVNVELWGRIQDWITPVWKLIGHGCHVNRKSGLTVASIGGWKTVDYKSVRPVIDLQSRIMPLSFGKAIKAND